ncbi:hypothetical protein SAMN04488109_1065 [Chryseolinea serpens]|uniref:Uncharacterized protein n=1 Tax=Chryseolinea serpens TaxID=947013 RepID=A0A1M5L7R0_9BACT|nr:hypothetical protein [Chryseolinea serpens]SHG61000.1 hypothetical protein SAMN04488109_1065 [Chryseolinea serpens]
MNIRVVTAFLFFVVAAPCLGQDTLELDKRNGFKDIHLNAPIDSVTGSKLIKEFKEKDEFPARLYEVINPLYEKIGEVNVEKIELKTYKDMVYEIRVLADKDPRLMKALESLYGKADYDIKNETYFWKSDKMILKFHAAGKHKLEMLYISYGLHKMMKADKDKKVDDIANDF